MAVRSGHQFDHSTQPCGQEGVGRVGGGVGERKEWEPAALLAAEHRQDRQYRPVVCVSVSESS